jgi:CubicO group peptidase (beta-lactamase class C family)
MSKLENIYEEAMVTARTQIWQDIGSGKAGSATVAILDNSKIVYSEGFGMANRERGVPVDHNTLFNIGSITKVFTAAAIMLLVDDGKVELDTPVFGYLPEFVMADPRYKDITVRMTLNHTSGLPGTTAANNFGFKHNTDYFRQTMENLSRSHLKHAPGAMALYCNDGFTLAEMIVECISGQKFADFLSERSFKRLLLTNTGLSVGERSNETIASYYQPGTGKKEAAEVVSIIGVGGFGSTAEDLCRFANTFSGSEPQILSKSALVEMKKAQPALFIGVFKNPLDFSFGLGWDMTSLPYYQSKGIQLLAKFGQTTHYSSFLVTLPEQKISVALMESGPWGNVRDIALNVLKALVLQKRLIDDKTSPVSKPPQPQSIPPQYAVFEGYYAPLMRISFNLKENTVNVMAIEKGVEILASSLYYSDGYFYDATGKKSYFTSADGQDYYVSVSGFDTDVITAQKLKKLDKPQRLKITINGQLWLIRNAKPFDSIFMATATHLVKSSIIEALPGYVDFAGIKEIKSSIFAGMPISALSDQTELTLLEKDGKMWAQLSDILYSPEDVAVPLKNGNKIVIIGVDSYDEWLKTDEDLILSFQKPAEGRVIVFSPNSAVIYDSSVDKGDVYVKSGSFIELSARPGDVFSIVAK